MPTTRRTPRLLAAATALAACALSAPAAATEPLPPLDPSLLDRVVAGLPDDDVTSAIVDVTGRSGGWSGTAGQARLGSGVPPEPDGEFRIGSITKVFTSTLVLQLAGEERVSLDRPVQRYLPGLLPHRFRGVTVRQLLDHTSGLPVSHVDDAALDPAWFVRHRFDGWTPRQVVTDALGREAEFAPGTAQSYNGTNYFLAGMLVEKVTGHSYRHALRTRILEPLGLRHTYLPVHGNPFIRGPHAHGYLRADQRLHDVTEQNPYAWAEGGMVSTTGDLERMLGALADGTLLRPAQRRELHRVPTVPYVGGPGHCRMAPEQGRSCFSVMFEATRLPNGVTIWGKSGSVPGYAAAIFATRDLDRVLTYSMTPTARGTEGRRLGGIVGATFDPSLLPPG